jgi:hypothetical protein
MRIGFNPHKDQKRKTNDFFHQVIIPVYIPNQESYFKDSLELLKYCLNSLILTSHSKTYLTIVANGCCVEVRDYIDKLFSENKIHEIIYTTAIGKLNAVLKGIVGHNFPLITISDADVLFLNKWQSETYDVFNAFPKAGAVSTTPNSKMVKHFTSSIFIDTLFSKKVQFSEVENPIAMQSFAESIGNPTFFKKVHLEKYVTVTSQNNTKAVIGAGHFVATYRGEIFNSIKNKYSNYSLGGDSEIAFLDKPVQENNLWRLSTINNFTYHLGNTKEDWMQATFDSIQNETHDEVKAPTIFSSKSNKFLYWLKVNFLGKILFKKEIWRLFLQYKGLSKSEAKDY